MNNNPILQVDLSAAILTVKDDEPYVFVKYDDDFKLNFLPFGSFNPKIHKTLAIALRDWVKQQTGYDLKHVEQLYTFGDRGRHYNPSDKAPHVISIGYLALIPWLEGNGFEGSCGIDGSRGLDGNHGNQFQQNSGYWEKVYKFFPWEDRRYDDDKVGKLERVEKVDKSEKDKTHIINELVDLIERFNSNGNLNKLQFARFENLLINQQLSKKILDRYELLYEIGLIQEAKSDARETHLKWGDFLNDSNLNYKGNGSNLENLIGKPMLHDHRRILATAMSRLRGKIEYEPLYLDLMPNQFTLIELQKTYEAIRGEFLHKQNFRRRILSSDLIKPTNKTKSAKGRPAKLFERIV